MRSLVLRGLEKNTDIVGDDIIIFAETIDTYILTLEKLFDKLSEYDLKVSAKKNIWIAKSV